MLDKTQTDCVLLLDTLHGVEIEKEELLTSPSIQSGTASQKTPPTPTAPGPRSTIIPEDIADALRHQQHDTLEQTLKQQQDLLAGQDEKLTQITKIAVVNKETAIAIRDEVHEQNRILEIIAGQTDEANAKITVAQRRVKRI